MATNTADEIKKEIAIRQQNGIPVNDLQAKLNSFQTASNQATMPSNIMGGTLGNMAPNLTGSVGYKPLQGQAQGTNDVNNGNATQATSAPPKTVTQLMEEARKAQVDATVSGLRNRYNQTISDINAKKDQLAPTYDAKRLTAQSSSQLQAKNFAEFLANRGLSRSGTSQQAEITRNLALQNEIAGLNKQQQDELSYYNRMADSATSALNNDISSAENQAMANYLDNFMKYQAEQETLKAQQDFQREQNKASQELAKQQLLNNQYELGKNKQNDAIDSFTKSISGLGSGYDYQGEINAIKNDGDPTNDWKVNYLLQAMNKSKESAFNNAVTLSELTGSIDANQLINQMSPETIKSYEAYGNQPGGFASAINATSDPRQQKILEAFRNRYLEANPDNPYYNTRTANVMVPTLKGQTTQSALQTDALQRTGLDIANKINQMKLDYLPEETKTSLNIAKEQLKSGQLDNAAKTIQNSNLDNKLKAEISNIYANIAQGWKQLDISQQNANTSSDNLKLSQDEFKAKKDAGAYDPEMYNLDKKIKASSLESNQLDDAIKRLDSMFVTKVFDKNKLAEVPQITGNPERMRQAILGLGLNDTQTRALLSRYGLSTQPAK